MRTAQGMDEEEGLVPLTEVGLGGGGVARRGRQTSSSSTCVLNSDLCGSAIEKVELLFKKSTKVRRKLNKCPLFCYWKKKKILVQNILRKTCPDSLGYFVLFPATG